MKKQIIEDCIKKQMKWKEGARILVMHPKALSRLKKNYLSHGECVVVGRKPGPNRGSPDNKTPDSIEEIVEEVGADLSPGPVRIAEILFENMASRCIKLRFGGYENGGNQDIQQNTNAGSRSQRCMAWKSPESNCNLMDAIHTEGVEKSLDLMQLMIAVVGDSERSMKVKKRWKRPVNSLMS